MKTRLSMKLVWLGLAVASTLALASAANAQPGEFVKGVLQPLADGFPKRAITIVVVDEPGSRDDLYAKSLQAVSKNISPVPILVSDEQVATGGTYYVLKDLPNREGGADGYYPVIAAVYGPITDLLVEPLEKELGVQLSDMNMVIVTESMRYTMIQRKNAPWGKTFAGMVKYAKENPGKLKYISNEVGSGHDIACTWVMQQVGITADKIPMRSQQEVASVVGAGEGDFAMISPETALTNWQAGRVDVILLLGSSVPAPWDKDPNVITSESFGLPKVPFGTTLGIAVPRQVPQTHIDWLFKLFKAAALSDQHKKREQMMPGLKIQIIDGAEANTNNKKLYDYCDPVVRSLGMHWEQQQKK